MLSSKERTLRRVFGRIFLPKAIVWRHQSFLIFLTPKSILENHQRITGLRTRGKIAIAAKTVLHPSAMCGPAAILSQCQPSPCRFTMLRCRWRLKTSRRIRKMRKCFDPSEQRGGREVTEDLHAEPF